MNRKVFIMVSALMLLAGPVRAQGDNQSGSVTINQSPAIVSNGKPVRTAQYINLKPGQDREPLTMYYQNGDDKNPGFSNFSLSIAGLTVIDQSAFKNQKVMKQDLSGQIQSGNSQVLFSGQGPAGATFSWKLIGAQATISMIQPNEAKVADKITIKGHNFGARKSDNTVMFEGTQGTIVKSSPDSIDVTVPEGLKSGDTEVTVSTFGLKSNAVKIKVKAGQPPVLSGIDYESAYSGLPVTISGKNFDKDMSKNIVKFGDLVAPVMSGNETSLNVAIPEMDSPQWYVPITVTSDGLKSTNSLSINVQRRVF